MQKNSQNIAKLLLYIAYNLQISAMPQILISCVQGSIVSNLSYLNVVQVPVAVHSLFPVY